MLRYNDRITVSAVITLCKDGTRFDGAFALPIEEDLNIREDVLELKIFEHDEYGIMGTNRSNKITHSFKICIGQVTSLRQLGQIGDSKVFERITGIYELMDEIESTNDKICYFVDSNGVYHVFAKINKGDIVVEDVNQLKEVLTIISKKIEDINASVQFIKELGESETIIPEKTPNSL